MSVFFFSKNEVNSIFLTKYPLSVITMYSTTGSIELLKDFDSYNRKEPYLYFVRSRIFVCYIHWKLNIIRSLGPGNFVCYFRYFVISEVKTIQNKATDFIGTGQNSLSLSGIKQIITAKSGDGTSYHFRDDWM